jgi:hypothetical protein
MNRDSFLMLDAPRRRAPPGHSAWPNPAAHVARLLRKEMSNAAENQDRAQGMKTLTTHTIDVNPAALDLRQRPVS